MQAAIVAIKSAAAWLAKKGLAQAVVKLGLQLAATAVVSKLTAPSPGRAQGLLIQTDLSAESPRRVQVGKRLNGGVFVDWLTKGSINEDTWRIFYLGEGPMGNITKIFADGRVVYNGTLQHGQEVTLTALDSRVRVRYYDGRPGQTADANLLASGVGWTANHVGTGVAYCVVYARFHDTKLVVPPDMSFEVEGAKLYDRRLDSTAGGTGSQRLKDPSTWALSSNPAVALDHFLLGRFLSSGDDEPWFGVGLDPALVPYADFVAMANLCDEQVALKAGGTQDRYSMNGFIFADEVFRDVIRRICDHMNARPADFGGLISVIDGESKVPVLTLDKSDAIDESAEVYKPKAPWSQIVGGVEGRYQDPANNYQPTDYPRYTEAAWKTEDGGETKYVTRDFDYEVNQERAERLASLYAKRARRQATLTGVYPISALVLEEGDWFTRTGGKFGIGKVFEVVGSPVLDVETMTVAVQAIEVDPADSAWDETTATDQADAPDADPSASALAVPSMVVTPVEVASGGTTIPGVRFTNNDYTNDPAPSVEIEVAEDAGSGVPDNDKQTVFMVPEQQFVILTGLLAATDYVARYRGRIGELESDWSSWQQFTSTGTFAAGSASTVPWSGVTDDGNRPDDNADVTGDNTAAAIENQDWGATASQDEAANSRVSQGSNGIYNPSFLDAPDTGFEDQGITPRAPGGWSNLLTSDASGNWYSGVTGTNYLSIWAPSEEHALVIRQNNNDSGVIYDWRSEPMRCEAGELVIGSVYAGAHRCTLSPLLEFLNSAGGVVSVVGATTENEDGVDNKYGGADLELWKRVYARSVAPAGAVSARIILRKGGTQTGQSDSYAFWLRPMLEIAGSNQLEPSLYQGVRSLDGLRPQEPNSNETEGRISAGYQNQDWGGTASEADASNAQQQWSDVGGAGRPDDNADVTATETAAAIAGQGGQATASFYRQTTAPPASEGNWWADTSTNELKIYTGGAWQVVATLSGEFNVTSPGLQEADGTDDFHIYSSVSVTVAGGVGPFTYAWEQVGGNPSNWYISGSTTSSSVSVRLQNATGGDNYGTFRCTVTDSTGAKRFVDVGYYYFYL